MESNLNAAHKEMTQVFHFAQIAMALANSSPEDINLAIDFAKRSEQATHNYKSLLEAVKKAQDDSKAEPGNQNLKTRERNLSVFANSLRWPLVNTFSDSNSTQSNANKINTSNNSSTNLNLIHQKGGININAESIDPHRIEIPPFIPPLIIQKDYINLGCLHFSYFKKYNKEWHEWDLGLEKGSVKKSKILPVVINGDELDWADWKKCMDRLIEAMSVAGSTEVQLEEMKKHLNNVFTHPEAHTEWIALLDYDRRMRGAMSTKKGVNIGNFDEKLFSVCKNDRYRIQGEEMESLKSEINSLRSSFPNQFVASTSTSTISNSKLPNNDRYQPYNKFNYNNSN